MTVAIGFFDGVHRGHQAILRGADVALTFENHPLSLLAPDRQPRLIMSWTDRAAAIMGLGVHVTALDFDADIANWSPDCFLERLNGYATAWSQQLNVPAAPLHVRCGASWRFGKGGLGDAAWLAAHGVGVTVVPDVEYSGLPISSTRIRAALEAGRLEDATAMLGRPFALSGEVFRGKGAGSKLGFPTLNVRTLATHGEPRVRLPLGVYAVSVAGECALANYGVAPTFGEAAWPTPVVEVHFLSAVPDLADGGPVVVRFERFVRPERKFASVDELRAQIAADCAKIRV